jgi:Na+/proline symporter
MHLALIDWCIIVVYLVGCMAAGLWMRRYIRGVEDFAVAGRSMDLNLGIASLCGRPKLGWSQSCTLPN